MDPLNGKRKLDYEAHLIITEIEKASFSHWIWETAKILENQGIQKPTDQQIADNMSRMKDADNNPVIINPDDVKESLSDNQYNARDIEKLKEGIRQSRNQLVFLYFEYTWKKIKKEYESQTKQILDELEEIYIDFLKQAADEIGSRRDGLGKNGEKKSDRKEGNYYFRFNPNLAVYFVDAYPCSYWWNWAWNYYIKTGLNKKIIDLAFHTAEIPLSYDYDSKGYSEKHYKIYKELKKTREYLEHKLQRKPTGDEVWDEYHKLHPEASENDFGEALGYGYLEFLSINTTIPNSNGSQSPEDFLESKTHSIDEEIYARFTEQDILAVASVIFEDPFSYQLVELHILNPDDTSKLKELAEERKIKGEALSLLLIDRLEKLFRVMRDWPFLSLDVGNPSGKIRYQAEKQLKELNRIDQAEKEASLGPLYNLYSYVKEKRSVPPSEDIALDLNVLLLRAFDKKLGEQFCKSADMRSLSKTLRHSESLKAIFYLGNARFHEENLTEHEAIQAMLRGYLNWLLWYFGDFQKQVEYKITSEPSQLLPDNDHFIVHFSSEESAQLAKSYLEDWRMKSSKDRGKRLMIFDALKKKEAFKNLDQQQMSLFIPDELHDLWKKKMKGQLPRDLTINGIKFKSINTESNARHQATIANYISWQCYLGTCVVALETGGKNIALKTL